MYNNKWDSRKPNHFQLEDSRSNHTQKETLITSKTIHCKAKEKTKAGYSSLQ